METMHGCDCRCPVHSYSENHAPIAWKVRRADGSVANVCTRCKLSTDTVIERLFDTDSDPLEFQEYDPLGFLVMCVDLPE